MRIFVIIIVCLALAAPASAGLYKWKDAKGKTHFTDDRSKIPLSYRNKSAMTRVESTPVEDRNFPSAFSASSAQKPVRAKKKGMSEGQSALITSPQ